MVAFVISSKTCFTKEDIAMQQGNRNPMDERNDTPREQDTDRERAPNRQPGSPFEGAGEEQDNRIDIEKTPGEQREVRRDPSTIEH